MVDHLPSEHLPTRWCRHSDALFVPVEHETVVLQQSSDEASVLDAVATQIWGLLEDPMTEEQMVEQLLIRFGGERDRIASDVSKLLSELEACSLVIRVVG